MAGLEAGMVCVKLQGREAGKKAVVLEFDKKKGLALIQGPKVKKRKCNPKHLLPTGKVVKVSKGIKAEEIAKLIE
jgi:large subunit ribosomal protein L14e